MVILTLKDAMLGNRKLKTASGHGEMEMKRLPGKLM